jgi:glycosyltransferase involved in cell wall biosynthesis
VARVAVIIPVFNGAATILEAIDSVLAQTYRDFELIVVDDGSTDSTPQILARYANRARIITRPNGGISAARNSGLRVSSSELIALLDCDDAWMPGMLEKTIDALDQHPGCVLAYTNLAVSDSNGELLVDGLIGEETAHPPTFDEMFTRLWPIMPSAVVIRRSILNRIGGFSEEFRSYGYEDAWCWLQAREIGPFCYLPESLVKWRFSSYPRTLKQSPKNAEAQALFANLVRERWGRSVEPLIRARMRASRSILGYIGLRELRKGNRELARDAFARALKIDPSRIKNYFRYARTFLPTRIARILSGSSARQTKQA